MKVAYHPVDGTDLLRAVLWAIVSEAHESAYGHEWFPSRATISVLVLIWMVGISSMRQIRYRDMLAERLLDRTTR